jgi:hypothetical protein
MFDNPLTHSKNGSTSLSRPHRSLKPAATKKARKREQSAARMREMRRKRKAGLIPVRFHISRRKLRLITATREALPDDIVGAMSDQQLLESMLRGVAIWSRVWLRRRDNTSLKQVLRVTAKPSGRSR